MIDVRIAAGRAVIVIDEPADYAQVREVVERAYRHHLRTGNPPLPIVDELTEKLTAAARLPVSSCGQMMAPGDLEPASFTTTDKAAEALGCHPRTISRRAAADQIPGAKRHGRDWLIPITYITQELSR